MVIVVPMATGPKATTAKTKIVNMFPRATGFIFSQKMIPELNRQRDTKG
jgi:hypothetical protein